MRDAGLKILVIDENAIRAAILEEGLRASGVDRVVVLPDGPDLQARVAGLKPDVIVVHLESPSRDVLEQMSGLSRQAERPVAMFVDRSDEGLSAAAIEAGVSAYVVDGMQPARVKPILDAAIARFRMFQRMRLELAETKKALEERKVIDRAKGMIMKARGVDEDQAYAILRKAAMDQNRRVADVAAALVSTVGLLS